ncbi:MAG TPA: TonB-dependent receptor [Candidatus Saccharimonadales bacterium]|nr:TonB-dependent receptor [Candidatus Saccharimonadales bacterium]
MSATARLPRLALLAAVLALGCLPALAQSSTSTLVGTISTHEGTPVPDVVVRARSAASGVVRVAISEKSGRYRFDLLEPGTWVVRAEIPGGVTSEPKTVTLGLLQTVVLDFTVGPVLRENVTITAEEPLVDPSRTGGELRLDRKQVEDLPIYGRQITDLAMLDSSVTATPPGDFTGESGTVFTVNGQSGRSNTFLVDGLDNNDMISNTTMSAPLSALAIREFVVETRQFAPEFGRASGGVLNVITERGGNDFKGDFLLQGVPGNLSEPGGLVSSLPNSGGRADTGRSLNAGFSVGGPFIPDKAFYFLAYEHMDENKVVPFTGVDRSGQHGGWILSPGGSDEAFFRGDFNLGHSQLMTRLTFGKVSTDSMNIGGRATPESGFTLDTQDIQLATSLTTVISPSLSNEVRLLGGTSSFDQLARSDRPGVERPSGIFGGNNLYSQSRGEDSLQLVENLTWQAGNHAAKAGMDVINSRTRISTRFNPNGNFLYDTDVPFEPGDCGDLVASQVDPNDLWKPIPCPGIPNFDDDGDGLTDEPGIIGTYPIVYTLIEGHPSATLDDTKVGLFVQDSWQATPKFLLQYGLRYDVSTYTLPPGSEVPSTIPNGGAGRDRNNIAPRLGFSWTPGDDGRFVVRGGAGVFYDKLVLAFPAVAAITSGTAIGMIFPQGLTLELTEGVVEDLGVKTVKQILIFPQSLTLRFSTGEKLDTPYSDQYSLGFDSAVGDHGAFGVTVTRALGYHLPLMRDLNPVIDPKPLEIPVHRDPNTGSIAAFVTEGRSWYTAADFSWRWRGETSWYQASYTWSKAIDMGPDPLKGGIALPPDSDHIWKERGRSDSDRRHRVVFSGGTALPWWGLRISGALQAASGAPFNVTTGKDENMDGIASDRPAGVGRNTGSRTDLGVINSMRKAVGLSAVHHLEEPNFYQVDLKLSRPFAFRQGGYPGELYVQIFNLFDRFNGGPVDGAVLSDHFGEPIGMAGPARTVVLGLKMGFGSSRDRGDQPPDSSGGSGSGDRSGGAGASGDPGGSPSGGVLW